MPGFNNNTFPCGDPVIAAEVLKTADLVMLDIRAGAISEEAVVASFCRGGGKFDELRTLVSPYVTDSVDPRVGIFTSELVGRTVAHERYLGRMGVEGHLQ